MLNKTKDDPNFTKLVFKLKIDEDGYPPVGFEALWAIKLNDGLYKIDNIPMYVCDISKGDFLSAEYASGEWSPVSVKRRGGHTTLRIFIENQHNRNEVIENLKAMGASVNLNLNMSLFAIDIPPNSSFLKIDEYLENICNNETIAYEDACLQHKGISEERINECKTHATVSE